MALVILSSAIMGIWLFQNKDTAEDFSFMYVEPVNRLLAMAERDASAATALDSGVLYLDTSNVTQTECRYLVAQTAYYANQYALSVDACSREEAALKGYIQFDESGKENMPKTDNCIWIIISDRATDNGAVQANFCLYFGSRGAYFCDITMVKEDGRWVVTDISGGVS